MKRVGFNNAGEVEFWDDGKMPPEEVEVAVYNHWLKNYIKLCGKYAKVKRRCDAFIAEHPKFPLRLTTRQSNMFQAAIDLEGDLAVFRDALEDAANAIEEGTNCFKLTEQLLESSDRRRYYLRVINRSEVTALRKIQPLPYLSVQTLEDRYQRCLKRRQHQ